MTKLNIGTKATSTIDGLIAKIYELQQMIAKGKFKGQKEITARRNLAWYKSELVHGARRKRNLKKRSSVKERSKSKRK